MDETVAGHRFIHEMVYRDSILTVDPPGVKRIGEDVAILHFWTRAAIRQAHPAGPHSVDTLLLTVATRRDGGWQIAAGGIDQTCDPAKCPQRS